MRLHKFALLFLCCLPACENSTTKRNAIIIETRILNTGDKLLHEVDGTHNRGGWGEASTDHIMYLEWKETGTREVFQNGGFFLAPQARCSLQKTDSWFVLSVGKYVFCRERANPTKSWTEWSLYTSAEFYEFLRDYLLERKAKFDVKRDDYGRHWLLVSDWRISTNEFPGFNLPYEIENVCIESNFLTVTLVKECESLPATLVWSGKPTDYGGWKFDRSKTETANQASQSASKKLPVFEP